MIDRENLGRCQGFGLGWVLSSASRAIYCSGEMARVTAMRAKLTIGRLAELVEKVDVHCQKCQSLFKLDVRSVKASPGRSVADVENGEIQCAGCGSGLVRLLVPESVRLSL